MICETKYNHCSSKNVFEVCVCKKCAINYSSTVGSDHVTNFMFYIKLKFYNSTGLVWFYHRLRMINEHSRYLLTTECFPRWE